MSPAAINQLNQNLLNLVRSQSLAYNTTIVAAVYGDGVEVEYAAGVNDRHTNSPITVHSRIPSGSVTKAWTSLGLMRFVESGDLDLDTPAYLYIDKWLEAQDDLPYSTLLELWQGNTVINTVTVGQIMSMRGGFQEYSDDYMLKWTIEHPSEDYSPYKYIEDLNKTFVFPPGDGGQYSSDGYVLAGMVLA